MWDILKSKPFVGAVMQFFALAANALGWTSANRAFTDPNMIDAVITLIGAAGMVITLFSTSITKVVNEPDPNKLRSPVMIGAVAVVLAVLLAGCQSTAGTTAAKAFDEACAKRHTAYQLFQGVVAIFPDKISPLAITRVDQAYNVANEVCSTPVPTDYETGVAKVQLALSAIAKEVAAARSAAAK